MSYMLRVTSKYNEKQFVHLCTIFTKRKVNVKLYIIYYDNSEYLLSATNCQSEESFAEVQWLWWKERSLRFDFIDSLIFLPTEHTCFPLTYAEVKMKFTLNTTKRVKK